MRGAHLVDGWLKRVMILSDFVTAREREPGEGERGSPAAGKGIVCLQGGYAPQSGGKHAQGVFVG